MFDMGGLIAALFQLLMKKIKINRVEYTLKNVIRNFFVYEEIKGAPFVFGKLVDEYLLFYSTLIANNETFSMQFSDFIDVCDANPQLFAEYKAFVVAELEKQAQTANAETDKPTKKKSR